MIAPRLLMPVVLAAAAVERRIRFALSVLSADACPHCGALPDSRAYGPVVACTRCGHRDKLGAMWGHEDGRPAVCDECFWRK